MEYSVKQLADLAGVTVRTLHHYDAIGLLKPSKAKPNGYRVYEEPELLRLQQILFFRELNITLEEIKNIIDDPNFDTTKALLEHKKLMQLQKARLTKIIKTINNTIKKMNDKTTMDDQDLYDGLSKKEIDNYTQEAKQRWGNTDAYKQSQKKYASLSKEDRLRIQQEADDINYELVKLIDHDPASPEVQNVIARWYQHLSHFYTPTPEIFAGLANMYVDDERFAKHYRKYHQQLPELLREAMLEYSKKL